MPSRLSAAMARFAGWPRRLLAAALLVAGAVSAVAAAAPPVTAPVVVTVRGVAAGAAFSVADVMLAHRPAAGRPAESAVSVAEVVGQRAVSACTAGEVITKPRLAPAAFTLELRHGNVAVGVPVAAASASIVRTQSSVDVVAAATPGDFGSTGPTPTVLVSDARVLAVWAGTELDHQRYLVLDVPADMAPRLAVAQVGQVLAVVIRDP